ncbi:sensor histidine kinase [Rhodocytophaga rosea]|uniref:Sensor histidine kinase n=1 Tax=Rhodocytophaga rosea TaxID=2704465 RepID=A0A6C0GRJ9_9BACT|nr:histidine kinase [Rhodocytophaga rosea]QHT70172.1 sensor histidine kinase [Rhodocytophaga rosea]
MFIRQHMLLNYLQNNQFLRPTGLINRLLQPSGISLSTNQFWWYAFLYWSFFSVMWSFQAMLAWLLTPNARLYVTELIYWMIEFLFWWAVTPLIIYCAQLFPVLINQKSVQLFRQICMHVVIVAVLYMIELAIEYSILGRAMAYEKGEIITIRRIALVFAFSYGTAFSQYMLLVVCFNIFMHMYRFQALQQQHLRMELTNEQLKSQLAGAQLQSLKMQLNPHFLFNTLHTVVSLIIQHQNKKAAHMVTSLSDLLRGVLARRQANFLELREELQLTRQYLAIQQIRFEDKLRIEYAIEPEAEQCLVPQLILQPLVENAVTHGIADLTEGALIRIAARRSDSNIRIEVFDNGTGQNQLQPTSGTGLGLSNTLLRLQQAYGENASLLFEQPPGGTTTVSLLIPYL